MEKCLYKIAQEQDRRLDGYKSKCASCDGKDERCLNYRTLWDSIWDEIGSSVGDNFPVINRR